MYNHNIDIKYLVDKTHTMDKIRKTIDFDLIFFEQIKAHGKARGCNSFSETIRDLCRIVLNPNNSQQNEHKQLASKPVDTFPGRSRNPAGFEIKRVSSPIEPKRPHVKAGTQ